MKQRPTISDRRRRSEKADEQKGLCFQHADISHTMGVYSPDAERAERLREILADMHEANRTVPVIVEGRRDADALKSLGFSGEIITFHSGKAVYEFCNDIAERYEGIILLMDWDDKGEKIFLSIAAELPGYWEAYSRYRDILKILCQKDIKDIEGIPGLLERLSGSCQQIPGAAE